jgi:hypothetical protein
MGQVGVAPGTTTITLPDGSTIALADWIDDKLYGSVQITNGQTTPVEAFSTGRSQIIPGGSRVQTRVDTNIPRAGDNGLPKDWEMLIYGIGIKMVRVMRPGLNATPVLADGAGAAPTSLSNPAMLTTLFQVDRVTSFSFEYNGKIYSSGVIQHYPQGHGFSVFSTNSNFELAQNGVPSPRDRVAMVLPIHMRENLGYKGIFQPEAALVINQAASDGSTALTFADLRVDLNGLIKRTVV